MKSIKSVFIFICNGCNGYNMSKEEMQNVKGMK